MENNTTETRQALVDDVGKLKDQASQIAQDVKAHANAHVDEAQKRFTEAMSALRHEVSTRPLAILGAGIVLGYLFGVRRRRRSS